MKAFLPLLLVAFGYQSAPPEDEWPRVREFQASFGIDTSSERILLVLPIYNYNDQEEYRLVCIGGSTEYLDRLTAETGAHFVGPLQCNLLDRPEIYNEHTLLGEDGSPAWHTRGQFSWDDLVGDCGDYPEFGRLRHFRLRGFELTLKVEDVVLEDDRLDHFVLKVSLREDHSIRSRRTEQPGYIRPRQGCDVVVEGYERLMCRNPETLSWEECPDP